MSAYLALEKIDSIRFLKKYNNKPAVLKAQSYVTAEYGLCSFGEKCKSHTDKFDCKYNHKMSYEDYVSKVEAVLESVESAESAESVGSVESVVTGSVETKPVPPVQPPNCLIPTGSRSVCYFVGPDGKTYKQEVIWTWNEVPGQVQ